MPVRQHLFLIFKEVVNNCARHAQANTVHMHFKKTDGNFIMEITDNGKGFDKEKLHNGNGLKNLEFRARELKGNIIYETSPNGTKVTLSFPLTELSPQ